jgi:hypothetical protein
MISTDSGLRMGIDLNGGAAEELIYSTRSTLSVPLLERRQTA